MKADDTKSPFLFITGFQLGMIMMKMFGGSDWGWFWIFSPFMFCGIMIMLIGGFQVLYELLFD